MYGRREIKRARREVILNREMNPYTIHTYEDIMNEKNGKGERIRTAFGLEVPETENDI